MDPRQSKPLPTVAQRVRLARSRVANFALDTLDRLRGRCCRAPLATEGGYHFWRCGLRRGHKSPCRSGYYFWGPGGSVYDPSGDWAPGANRRAGVMTIRQARERRRWEALNAAKREIENVPAWRPVEVE